MNNSGANTSKESFQSKQSQVSKEETQNKVNRELPSIEQKVIIAKEYTEEKSEFTFGSGPRNSGSSKSSGSSHFPPEIKKFLTIGSGLESSSGGVMTDSQRNSLETSNIQRYSTGAPKPLCSTSSPAIPLRNQDRKMIKPIIQTTAVSTDETK